MSLYLQMGRLVDAEQVDVAKRVVPPEVIPWTPWLATNDGSIGYVRTGVNQSKHVSNHDWIVRPIDGGPINVYSPLEFHKQHVGYMESIGEMH